jgi:release factor glutamine methyltransferase
MATDKPLCNPRSLAQLHGLPLHEVRLLVEHVSGLGRAAWLSEPQRELPPQTLAKLDELLVRRQQGEPVAYLLESAEFYGRRFAVNPDVLIPRPETEELIEHLLRQLQPDPSLSELSGTTGLPTQTLDVLDVGTGSGVIAITLALEYAHLRVQASDISAAALETARRNAQSLKADVAFRQSDWLSAFDVSEPFDIIVSNPPYIMKGDIHLEQGDLRFEPVQALTDHADGLTAYTELARASLAHIKPGGALWVEHGYHQQTDIIRIFEQAGLCNVSGFKDLSGNPRIVCAFRRMDC